MAQVIIKNMNDLTRILEVRIAKALEMTQRDIYIIIQKHIVEYYKEPVFQNGTSALPLLYDRSYKMLNSLIRTEIVKSGSSLSCFVGVNPDYLNYEYIGGASGLDIWLSANQRFHGWTVKGDIEIWNDSMEEIGFEEGIKNLMKKNLKKCGVPIA